MISEARIQEDINAVPSLVLKIPEKNTNYDEIKKLESEITVIDMNTENEVFRGRCLEDESDFYNIKSVTCEGVLAYLLDVQYPPYVHTGSVALFLEDLLDYYNGRVIDKQKIYLGNVTVVDQNDYIRRESEDYDNIFNVIQNKLVKLLGGWIQIRRIGEKNYLDYLADYYESDQIIRFGENLIDLTKYIKSENIKTVIIPRGAENEESGQRLDITSVNNGVNYIKDDALISMYGWIEAVVVWDDVTLPENLLKKATDYLTSCRNMEITIDINAIDARLIGMDVRRLQPGMLVQVVSQPHHLDEKFLCTSKVTDLLNPSNDKVVLGVKKEGYTQTINREQKENNEKVEGVNKTLSEKIKKSRDDFNEEIKKASGLYKTEVEDEDGRKIICYHDKANIKDSQIQMKFTTAGFSISSDGGNSWYGLKVDGDFIANVLSAKGINAEWINAGYLSADRIRAGKIQSTDYKENESGVVYDLDKSTITSCWLNGNSHHMRLQMTKAMLQVSDLNETNKYASFGYNGVDVSSSDYDVSIMHNTIQISKRDGNLLNPVVFLNLNGLELRDGAGIKIVGTDRYYEGQTGRAEFSDGTYLTFRNGVLVGGNTLEGGAI